MHTTTRPPARPKPARSAVRRVRTDAAEPTPPPTFQFDKLRRGARPTTAKKKYTTSEELAELIRVYRRMRKRMQPAKFARLEEIINKMASGIWSRFRPIDSKDDFVNECWVACLMKAFHRIKPNGNAFSYITTVCINTGSKMRAEEGMTRTAEDRYRAGYITEERFKYHDPDPFE